MLEITCEVAFIRFFKVAKTWFVWHETWHTKLFGIYCCFEVVNIVKNSHMFEITCKVEF